MLRLEGMGELEHRIDSRSTVYVSARLRMDPAFDFGRSGRADFPELARYTRPLRIGDSAELELREAYLRRRFDWGVLTLGKQQVVWGVADGIKVLDVVNPMDLREFVLDEFEDSRIPLWTVNAQVPMGNWELQLLWLPDPSYHVAPRLDSRYEVTYAVPSSPPLLDVHLADAKRPTGLFAGSDVAARLSGFVEGWDLSFNYLYHHDDVPALPRRLGFTPGGFGVVVEPRYARGHVIGGTFGAAAGEATVRGEFGLFLNRPYSTEVFRGDGVALADELAYVLGVDWFASSGTFVSAQLQQNWILHEPQDTLRDRLQTYGTFLVQKRLRRDKLLLELFWIQSLNKLEGLVRPRISYELGGSLSLHAGADIFYGERKDLFGQYHDNDRITVGVEWSF
jgi:hypothetical protein